MNVEWRFTQTVKSVKLNYLFLILCLSVKLSPFKFSLHSPHYWMAKALTEILRMLMGLKFSVADDYSSCWYDQTACLNETLFDFRESAAKIELCWLSASYPCWGKITRGNRLMKLLDRFMRKQKSVDETWYICYFDQAATWRKEQDGNNLRSPSTGLLLQRRTAVLLASRVDGGDKLHFV